VIFVRCRTVANVLSMGFVVRKPGCTSPLIDMARAWWAGCRVGVGHERVAGRPAPPRSFGVPRQERRSGGLDLGDRLLDHGVATVIGLDLQQITIPVVTMAAAFLYRGLGLVASGCLKRGCGRLLWRVASLSRSTMSPRSSPRLPPCDGRCPCGAGACPRPGGRAWCLERRAPPRMSRPLRPVRQGPPHRPRAPGDAARPRVLRGARRAHPAPLHQQPRFRPSHQTGQGDLAQAVAATPPGDAWPDLGRQCRDGGFARPS
jgi:hypothetical protein